MTAWDKMNKRIAKGIATGLDNAQIIADCNEALGDAWTPDADWIQHRREEHRQAGKHSKYDRREA